MRNKKGQVFANLAALAVGIATLAIVLTVTFIIMSQAKTQIASIESGTTANMGADNGSIAYNATATLQSAVSDIPGWVPLIVIASIGAILLGLVSLFRRR